MLRDLKSREQRIETKLNEQQNRSNLNNCGKVSDLDTVSFATLYKCDINLHTDSTDIITVIITTAMFDLFCVKIYVQGLYDQTVVIEENDVNVKKYEKCMVINVNEYVIMRHHKFCGLNVLVNYVNVNFVDHEDSMHQLVSCAAVQAVLLLSAGGRTTLLSISYEFYCLLHAALSFDPSRHDVTENLQEISSEPNRQRNCGRQERKLYYVASEYKNEIDSKVSFKPSFIKVERMMPQCFNMTRNGDTKKRNKIIATTSILLTSCFFFCKLFTFDFLN